MTGETPRPTAPSALLRILIVDDETIVRDSLGAWFRQDGHHVEVAESARDALRMVAAGRYDLAFLDIKMPGMDGLELQARLAEADPELTIVVMTAYAAVDTAVAAMKAGAYDYIVKPFDPDDLSLLVKRAAEHRSLRAENMRLRRSLESASAPPSLIGSSKAMRHVLELVESVAQSDSTVLITGESGTGKEVVARAIHAASPRRLNPMVVVNCGALPEGILESELFGHEAGSFTGARARHKGKFEAAEGGTVFLDEIGEVSAKVQVELLRVLEDKVVTRLGGTAPVPVDFRTICATNRDLRAAVRDGSFREDLYWRLNVVHVHIPPLRERPEDVPVLAEAFLARFAQSMSRRPMRFADDARDALAAYPWPGNVRELQNAIERAVVVGRGEVVRAADLPVRVTQAQAANGAPGSLAEAERAHVLAVLDANGWNITRAARVLDVDRVTLYNKIRKYELKRPGENAKPTENGG
jgi:DNA-binding NtrC family response regulator